MVIPVPSHPPPAFLARTAESNLSRDVSTYNNRDAFKDMLDSVASKKTFEECKALVADRIEFDPGFKPFYEWCQSHDIPVVILSSGMEPLIRALLTSLVGAAASSAIPIVANDVKHKPDGTWEIVYRDSRYAYTCLVMSMRREVNGGILCSHFGHDKSLAIKPFREAREKLPAGDGGQPIYVYCGDGLSDLSAARETDLLFAKQGHGWCHSFSPGTLRG